ncbi:MAG: hypothetical protein AB7S26_31950 [Sandaracinaceae bacterium]
MSSAVSRHGRLAGVAAVALLASCSSVTQLIVIVDTDFDVPSEIDAVRVEVTGPDGMAHTTSEDVASISEFPLTLTVLPSGDSLGPVHIRAIGLSGGATVVAQDATVTLEAGRSLSLRMFLARSCMGVTCSGAESCVCGQCLSVARTPGQWSGSAMRGECGVDDAGVPPDAGAGDGGGGACTSAAQCDDGIDCTEDACTSGVCTSTPDDAMCTAGTSGMCIAGFGCQYDGCSPTNCVAGPCQTARCNGDMCVLESACGSDEECCAGACVPTGCDDGNVCTDDACGATGCVNGPNTGACDDSIYCNGADTCGGGTCSVHDGDPCTGASVCDLMQDRCVGCSSDADCPAPVVGGWGTCAFADSCAQSGTQTRTVTSFACVSTVCQPRPTTEMQACTRTTDGSSCGTTTFGGWGTCGGFSGTCGESGTRTRTRTDRLCRMGACADATSTDSGTCVRDTDGTMCMDDSYGMWGACGGFTETCDETGTYTRSVTSYACVAGACASSSGSETGSCSRTTGGTSCGTTTYTGWSACGGFTDTCDETGTMTRMRTDYSCSAGGCAGATTMETSSCTRVTGGTSCGTTMTGGWGACGGFSGICGQTGTQSRSVTTYTCGSGTCNGNTTTESQACSRSTDGNDCDNFATCRRGTCSGGVCNYMGAGCTGSQICCEPGICRSPGGLCP